MTHFKPLRLAALLASCLTFAAASHAQSTMTKEQYKAEKDSIEATYKTDKKACDSLAGNAKDICVEEAKGKEKVAKAELDNKQEPTPRNNEKLTLAKADAAYEVAKEKCDDLSGNPKDVCQKEAKAMHTKAKADAKAMKTSSDARADARADANDAQYKAEAEKCDALAGDAKASCVSSAKARFGKS